MDEGSFYQGYYNSQTPQLNNSAEFQEFFSKYLSPDLKEYNDGKVADEKKPPPIEVVPVHNCCEKAQQPKPQHKKACIKPVTKTAPLSEKVFANELVDQESDKGFQFEQIEQLFSNPFQWTGQASTFYNLAGKYPSAAFDSKMSAFKWGDHNYNSIQQSLPPMKAFPSDFNPREAKNMGHAEKVRDWLRKVPIYLMDDYTWFNDCYPGCVESSDESSDGLYFSLDEGDLYEAQARKVTRFVTKYYKLKEEKDLREERLPTANTLLYSGYSDDDFYIE